MAASHTCSDYPNQRAAQKAGDTIDADHDGIYCETLPWPVSETRRRGRGRASHRQLAQELRRPWRVDPAAPRGQAHGLPCARPAPVYPVPATWSPDGRRALLVDFDDSEREGVVLIDFTTEQPTARQLVPLAAGDVDSLLWAPDSLAFAYERNA